MKKQGTIQFRYGLSSSGKPVSIENAEKGQQYTCLSCGAPLVPRQGKIRQHHFAHKSNPDNCSFETYLHKLTKYFIRTLFEEKQKLIAVREPNMHPCDRMQVCPFIQHGPFDTCYFKEDNTINLLDFESCLEEEPIKGIKDPEKEFIADLLFKSESKEPVLVEVFVKHPCTAEKIESGLRIIEIEIHSEQDVENLLSGELNKCSGIKFYGFENDNSPTDKNPGMDILHGSETKYGFVQETTNCKDAFWPQEDSIWEMYSCWGTVPFHEQKDDIITNANNTYHQDWYLNKCLDNERNLKRVCNFCLFSEFKTYRKHIAEEKILFCKKLKLKINMPDINVCSAFIRRLPLPPSVMHINGQSYIIRPPEITIQIAKLNNQE